MALKELLLAAETRAKEAEAQVQEAVSRESAFLEKEKEREQESARVLEEKEAQIWAVEVEQRRAQEEMQRAHAQAAEAASREDMERAQEKEKKMQKDVIRLKKEKEQIAEELEGLRNSFLFQTHHKLSILSQSTSEQATAAMHAATQHAALLSARLEEADLYASSLADQICESQHAKGAKHAARPLLLDAAAWLSAQLSKALEFTRMRVPALRSAAMQTTGRLGALARFSQQAADATDYWILWVPVMLTAFSVWSQWLSAGFRMLGLRVQQTALGAWVLLSLIAFLLDTSASSLLSSSLSPAQLALVHVLFTFQFALCAVLYGASLLIGPQRMVAVVQLVAVGWVLVCYYEQLLLPLLTSAQGAVVGGDTFTRPHIFRSVVSVCAASYLKI